MIALLLAANLFAANPAPIDKRCEPLRAPVRVRLTVGVDQWKDAAPTIRRLIEETWSPSGLRFEWVDGGVTWNDVDLWIAVVPQLIVTGEPYPFGIIYFDADRPSRLARVSVEAALQWTRRYRARLLRSVNAMNVSAVDDRALIHRVLGYAAAHETGHYLLDTKSHASSGVMQAVYQHPEMMFDAASWRLDGQNAGVLKQRLSNCGAAYGSPK